MVAVSVRGNWIQIAWCQGGLRRPKPTLVLLLALLLGLFWVWQASGGESDAKKDPAAASAPAAQSKIVGRVNGEMISRELLGQEALRHYGKEVLDSLINKHLIDAECKRQNVTVSKQEVDSEIDRLARKFNLPVDQWLKMLKQERGIGPVQYANDIIRPTLALRKLAGGQLQPTAEELQREFDALYGPSVRARIIVTNNLAKAQEAWEKVRRQPGDFPNVAKQYSEDPSASAKGLIQPIRKHTGYKEIEQVAFEMQDGQVSGVVQIGKQFAIVKREQLLPAYDVKLEQARPRLEEILRDRKLRSVAHEVFARLKAASQVQVVFGNAELERQMPGVAATINGQPLTLTELATACIDRHGDEVLEGTIHRKLIEQALKRAQLTVSEADLDQEIRRVAGQTLPVRPDGSPDVDGWLKLVVKEQGVTPEIYRYDVVWPTVALRKLVMTEKKVEVSEEDLKKGFQANYGPKVKCRAIILDNPRIATRVWELAKKRGDAESFGLLAERYSCDPNSAAAQGEMPPVRRNGGEPDLEAEAFGLQKGEISGVIQVGTKYVILYCEGQTTPIDVDFATVRKLIYDDLFDKKQQLEMNDLFDKLKEQSTVDNFLAGTSHSPKRAATAIRLPPGMPMLEPKAPPGG